MASLLTLEEEERRRKEEEPSGFSKFLSAIDVPRQYLLEKTVEGLSDRDVERGQLGFKDVMSEIGLDREWQEENPIKSGIMSVAGDLVYDPLNVVPFGAITKGVKGAVGLAGSAPEMIKSLLSPNLGNPALTQDITRMAKGYQVNHPQNLPDWYKGGAKGRAAHLGMGLLRGAGDYMQMLASPRSAIVFEKYGISPSNAREMGRLIENLKNPNAERLVYSNMGITSKASGKKVSQRALANELHSQLAYTSSVFRKYMPNDKRREAFEMELGDFLFPTQRMTTASQLGTNAVPIREVLKLGDNISDDVINNHIGRVIPKSFGKEFKGNVSLNAKPFQPTTALAFRGTQKVPQFRDFQTVIKSFAGTNVPITKSTIRARAPAKWPKERVDKLMNSIHDPNDGYLSIKGVTLAEDRLLAHLNQLMIVKKGKSHDGFTVMFDQMKQGSGSPLMEKIFDIGSKNDFIAMDASPFKLGAEAGKYTKAGVLEAGGIPKATSVIEQTPIKSHIPVDPARTEAIAGATEKMTKYSPSTREYLEKMLSRTQGAAADINKLQQMGLLQQDDKKKRREGLLAY
jgi:hypothetical protein